MTSYSSSFFVFSSDMFDFEWSIFCCLLLLFAVFHSTWMCMFVIIPDEYNQTLVTIKTRLLCVNFWLADKPHLLSFCFQCTKHWNKTEIKQFWWNNALVLFQFYCTCKRLALVDFLFVSSQPDSVFRLCLLHLPVRLPRQIWFPWYLKNGLNNLNET